MGTDIVKQYLLKRKSDMGKEYVTEGAICMCKFGVTPGKLIVLDQKFTHMNGKKLTATDKNLGNVFQAPGFGTCRVVPIYPKPCVPTITRWSGAFDKVKINRIASPLLNDSKGTCAMGCPDCISFVTSGQIALPGLPQMDRASKELQGDLDPMGESLTLNSHQIESLLKVTIE